MKTSEALEAMSKTEIDAYAWEQHGIKLDARRTKADMIAQLQGALGEEAPSEVEAGEPSAPETVQVTITEAPTSPEVVLYINAARFALPVNRAITVPAWILPTLEAATGVRFTKE